MSQEIECPGCGARIPLDGPSGSDDPASAPASGELARTVETVIPATVCLDEDSRKQIDEAGLRTTGQEGPASSFGVFIAGDGYGSSPGSRSHGLNGSGSHSSDNGLDPDVSDPDLRLGAVQHAPPAPDFVSDSNDIIPPAAPDPVLAALQTPGSSTSVPGDTFLAPFSPAGTPSESAPSPDAPPAPSKPTSSGSQTDDEGSEEPGRSLGSVLLASYASALTLALLWLIWTGRVWQTPPGPPSIPSDSLEEVESGAFLQNLPKLPVNRRAPIGKPIRVGDLEITPLAVEARRETLVSLDGKKRKTEPGTLTLRLRLRNLSDDQTFAPFEPPFVRVPDRGPPETILVAGNEPIFPYPLALQSERSVKGQSFAPLPPGAERQQILVSAPGARDKLAPSMTWRVRLRTSPGQTDTIGIDFQKGDVHP